MASDALDRVLAQTGVDDLLRTLVSMPGADLTTLLLEVGRARAAATTPADVLRQAGGDRFVQPAVIDGRALHAVEAAVLAAVPSAFDVVVLSPLAALGTCSSVATVHQHKVVTTVRRTEVAADPTNALAVLAASRRRRDRSQTLHLATVQRVVRAQVMPGGASAHFSLCGLVTAGRTSGQRRFEASMLPVHVQAVVTMAAAAGATDLVVHHTDLGAALEGTLRGIAGAAVVDDPHRTSGRGYYRDACFKVHGTVGGVEVELADGGFVDWTARLLGDAKERLLVSGLGLDRLVPPTTSGRP